MNLNDKLMDASFVQVNKNQVDENKSLEHLLEHDPEQAV